MTCGPKDSLEWISSITSKGCMTDGQTTLHFHRSGYGGMPVLRTYGNSFFFLKHIPQSIVFYQVK